jgi:hypothetical protein
MPQESSPAGNDGGKTGKPSPPSTAKPASGPAAQSAVEMLKADHRLVEKLFKDFETAEEGRKQEIIEEVCEALIVHSLIEEKVFYPACRAAASDEEPLDEAQVEHDSAKFLIADLMRRRRGDPYREAKVKVLFEQIKHHVAEEERPGSGVMAKAQAAGIDTPELARRLSEAKQSLESRPPRLPRPVSLTNPYQEKDMPRYQDDDREYYRARDDEGRFTSRGGRDGDGGGRGRGHGGWFGDPEGHSEASRRGWEEREGGSRYASRSRDYDDDDRRSSRGGYYRERDEEGRFASRGERDYDDDRRYSSGRGHGGWFGDPEGHSEASRRGWEEREGGSRYSSRSRDDDDDRRYSRSRGGHGGWFGDREGHSEASREGWDRRR